MNRARRPLKSDSQCTKILGYLSTGRTLTPMQALKLFRVMALSQRCTQLRERGHDVRSTMIRVGEKRVASYFLEGK